ncbi:Hydrazine synthase subunit gamma [uncultured bacterium]|nr:Hydrazine synthase subunit gamma [uncultured bacterium]
MRDLARLLLVCLLLAACLAAAPVSVEQQRMTPSPTPTPNVTPVPLLLTPIAPPETLPPLPALGESQSSRALALRDDVLISANMDSDSLTLVDTTRSRVLTEIHIGDDPRSVAITPDGDYALATLRGDGALAVVSLESAALAAVYPVCPMPYGVVADGRRAFVSCFASDEIAVVNLSSGEVLYRVGVPNAPAALALSGEWLLVTHFYTGQVTTLNVLRAPFVLGTVNVETDGELSNSIVIDPTGTKAYIPQTRTGLALVSLQYMQDWFPVVSVMDLTRMTGAREARLTLSANDSRAANMPFDLAFSADGRRLYVILAGNDAVAVLDAQTRRVEARIAVGANPRAILLDDDGTAYVLNALDGTISIIDTASDAVRDTLQVTELQLDPQLLLGQTLFHRADGMSDGSMSCATCHFDGGMDARTWINFRSGPRNTMALGGAAALPPYHWSGDAAELHDSIEDTIRHIMSGDGLIAGEFDSTIDRIDAGRSDDLDALVAYVTSLEPAPSPYRQADGSLSDSAQRGMTLFISGSLDCGRCHTPPLYTDLEQHNLAGAAFSLEADEAFDTPTLRGLWATAPYMHDGVAQTLEELLSRTDPVHSVADDLTEQQLDDLIAFLKSL